MLTAGIEQWFIGGMDESKFVHFMHVLTRDWEIQQILQLLQSIAVCCSKEHMHTLALLILFVLQQESAAIELEDEWEEQGMDDFWKGLTKVHFLVVGVFQCK
jgi:hypothetical protein